MSGSFHRSDQWSCIIELVDVCIDFPCDFPKLGARIFFRLLTITGWSALLLALSLFATLLTQEIGSLQKDDVVFAVIVCTIGGIVIDFLSRRMRRPRF